MANLFPENFLDISNEYGKMPELEEKMSELNRPDPVLFHFRVCNSEGEMNAKGGATVIYHPVKKIFSVALCCPRDRFCKRVGTKIAKQRLSLAPTECGRRFAYTFSYEGTNEFSEVKKVAMAIAFSAANKVGNRKLATTLLALFC